MGATVTGWGLTSSGGSPASTLQEAEVEVISNQACSDHYPGKIESFHICASDSNNERDSCQGDSGGPLMLAENGRLSQVGVVSYGSECPGHGVYARVTEVKHWIQLHAEGALDSNCNDEIPYQPAMIVTGGWRVTDTKMSVEVILPSGQSCSLPDLFSPGRTDHTQSAMTACGGSGTEGSCDTFIAGEWKHRS